MATILSGSAAAWDRRYLAFLRQTDARYPMERTAPAFGLRAWLRALMGKN